MNKRITSAVAVYLIIDNDKGRILCTRRCNTGYQDGNYQVPAGHVEPGELPKTAAIREAQEELGIIVRPEDLKFVHLSARPQHDETGNRIDIFFHVVRWLGEVKNMEPKKCDHLDWCLPDELPKNFTPHVRMGIELGFMGDRKFSEITLYELKRMPLYELAQA